MAPPADDKPSGGSALAGVLARVCAWTLLILALSVGAPVRGWAEDGLLVFAAASLGDALDAAIAAYRPGRPTPIRAAYDASSTLARQITRGAPADLYISADPRWMDHLAEGGFVERASRVELLGNELVLIAPRGSAVAEIPIGPGLDLAGPLGDRPLAMADPDHVPAGLYGREALESLGAWEAVARRVVRAQNVRLALAFVARGEAALGIVYATDAAAEPAVRVVGTFPASSHRPIAYPAAIVAASAKRAEARSFLAFLRSPAAARVFARYGFRPLAP
jgi:molybdate transport system substrate-binding protein